MKSVNGRQIRVLHCPKSVAGHPQALARAERSLGLASRAVALTPHPFGFTGDGHDTFLCGENASLFWREINRWRLFSEACNGYDIVHFNFGEAILPTRLSLARADSRLLRALAMPYAAVIEFMDIRFLKAAGKGIVVTYQGDDARQSDYCARHFEINATSEVYAGYYSKHSDACKRRCIAAFDRYADRIFALNPDLLHVLPERATFLPYAHVDLNDFRPKPKTVEAHARPHVVHAPSYRGVKGTRFVLDAVSRLKADGLDFDFTLVEGRQHADARRIYEEADLFVDQLLIGWYGGVAVEAMALAKPVIGYIREEDLKFVPQGMRKDLPIIRATPRSICDVLRECLTSRFDELALIGSRGRAYVEKWHDPIKIAGRLKTEYEAILAGQ